MFNRFDNLPMHNLYIWYNLIEVTVSFGMREIGKKKD